MARDGGGYAAAPRIAGYGLSVAGSGHAPRAVRLTGVGGVNAGAKMRRWRETTMANVGDLYVTGRVVTKNYTKAMEWFCKAVAFSDIKQTRIRLAAAVQFYAWPGPAEWNPFPTQMNAARHTREATKRGPKWKAPDDRTDRFKKTGG